jgi:hypothetical protein
MKARCPPQRGGLVSNYKIGIPKGRQCADEAGEQIGKIIVTV